MRMTRRIAVASLMAVALATPAFADDKPTILASVPGLTFPFFVHMMKAFVAEGQKEGFNVLESDGQVSSPKQTADIEAALTKGVKGIVLSPNEVDAMAPALQEAVDANVPVVTVDRRVPSVKGHSRPCRRRQRQGRRGAGQSRRQPVPGRRDDRQLAGPVRREPGDRSQQGPAQRARQGGLQIQDRVRTDRRLRSREGSFGDRSGARRPDDAAAGNRSRQRRHGFGRDGGGQGAQPQEHRDPRLRRAAGIARADSRRRPHGDDRTVPRQAMLRWRSKSSPTTSRTARSPSSR